MTTLNTLFKNTAFAIAAAGLLFTTSCSKDDDTTDDPKQSKTYSYEFNNGQVANLAYDGDHRDDFSADLMIEESTSSTAKITVTLKNTIDGAVYNIHSHDAADPATTPNGTPYNESPNADVLVTQATGNGGDVTVTYDASMSYSSLVNDYNGFFVIHDPTRPMSTTNIQTYLTVGTFGRAQAASGLESKVYNYDFNTGQVAAAFAYTGSHPSSLSASLKVQELVDGTARVSVMLKNTVDGEMYMIHSHDMADPATTPNGTPYNESPNADVLVQMAMGNGADVNAGQLSTMTYTELTSTYEAFFVVHDPLQAITTVDPTTYVLLGVFAQ